MNQAHWHLVVNHFPIIGVLFGLGITAFGLFRKNITVQQVGLVVLVIAAVFGIVAMQTGEGAEEVVEQLGISHHIIHEHEEMAEKFILLSNLTGILAITSLLLIKRKHKWAKTLVVATVVVALGTSVLGKLTGTTGGEIRHTEIRDTNTSDND